MLFGKSKDVSYGLPVLKHIAEIIVGNDSDLYSTLRTVSAGEIISTLKSRNVQAQTAIQQLREYIKFLRPNDDAFIAWFDKQLTITLMQFNDFNLPYEYSKVPYVEKQLRAKLERDIRPFIGNRSANFSNADWSVIMHDFSTNFLEKYSGDWTYDPATNGIVKFIVKAFSFYMKSKSSFLLSTFNTEGLNTEVEGTDYSRADYMTAEVTYFEDLVGFDRLAHNIYQVSNFMYRHNQRVYYDLFSRHKFKLVEKKYEKIVGILGNAFEYASIHVRPELLDVNFTVSSSRVGGPDKYAREKQKYRDEVLSFLDPLLEDKIGPKNLETVIKDMEEHNASIYFRTAHGKEQRPPLAYDTYNPKDGMKSNDDRLRTLIVGMCALRDFLKYCDRMHINVLKVPSAIFKNELLLRRFKTFKEYRELYPVVSELMQEASEHTRSDLMTNDQVYADIFSSHKLDSVRSIPLGNIKDAIQQYNSQRAAKIKSVEEPLVQFSRLMPVLHKYERFIGKAKGEKTGIPEAFARIYNIIVPPLKEHLNANGFLHSSNGIFWDVDPRFSLKSYVSSTWNEGIYRALRVFIVEHKDERYELLSFLRSMDFIYKFLLYVAHMIKLLNKNNGLDSELRLYLLVSKNIEGFTMPKHPKHNDEFSWFQETFGLEYYVPVGWELQDLNGQLLKLYNEMHAEFDILFKYLDELYRGKYANLSNSLKLVEQSPYEVPENLLGEASFSIYVAGDKSATEYENFKRFRNFCDKDSDKYGFLFRRGKMYKQLYMNEWHYLHEWGYWVKFQRNKFTKIQVSKTDEFGS